MIKGLGKATVDLAVPLHNDCVAPLDTIAAGTTEIMKVIHSKDHDI